MLARAISEMALSIYFKLLQLTKHTTECRSVSLSDTWAVQEQGFVFCLVDKNVFKATLRPPLSTICYILLHIRSINLLHSRITLKMVFDQFMNIFSCILLQIKK